MTAINKALHALLTVLRTYGYTGVTDLTPTEQHWLKLAEAADGNWIKVAKYKLAAFYSFHNQQTIPAAPFTGVLDKPGHLLGGGAGRFMIKKLRDERIREGLLQSILQSKKGMPRPTPKDMKATEQKFVIKMTTVPQEKEVVGWLRSWADAEDYPANVELLLSQKTMQQQLERTVYELFLDRKMTYAERIRAFFPSTSANYINSRDNNGAVGTIIDDPDLLKGLRVPGGHMRVERVQRREEEEKITKEEQVETEVVVDTKRLDAAYETLWHRMMKKAMTEIPDVRPVPVSEPLKTRMITAGPPLTQTVLTNMWRVVHGHLRKHPAFRLIGQPVTESYLLDRLGALIKDDEVYISGDYEAATDNLKSWVSETIADALSDCLELGAAERALFKRALTQHVFEGHKQQMTGQLMGSIVSFPVLCIANAALCRWAMEVAEVKVIKLHDAKLMINGDDCAMRTKKETYQLWHHITNFAGLKESMGKTYVSRDFVNINSTSFETHNPHEIEYAKRDGSTVLRMCPFRLSKYVNAGLLTGMKRSNGKVGLNDQTSQRTNISMRARQLLKLAPEELHPTVMKTFIHLHREVLDKMRLPWYIPEWLGGVGLPIGPWGGPSELDLRIARRILLHWAEERPIALSHQEVSWRTWQLAQNALPEPVWTEQKGEWTEYYNSAVGQKCVDLLFDSNVHLDQLREAIQEGQSAARAIAKNAKLWRVSRNGDCKLPPPLTLRDLEFRARYANWTFSTPPPQPEPIAKRGVADMD